jgi:pimeloyl-ACP methyl ester carboxylesterase
MFAALTLRRRVAQYRRRAPLVLINGLAEQTESWFANVDHWRRHFDVHTPNILAYDADAIHRRIEAGLPINIDHLVEQLRVYVDQFVQRPPYNLVANSMGGKVAVEFAARYPQLVSRLALLAPSGLAEREQLPVVEGVRRGNTQAVVRSVFYRDVNTNSPITDYFRGRFADRRWRSGLLRTVQGTKNHSIRTRLADLACPTLLVVGANDRIVDPTESQTAAAGLPHVRTIVLEKCGHAPQIEKANYINRLITKFFA